ncbi:MAG: hypothetical protein AB1457_17140 [Chloroflexota bacterium]
MKDTRSSPAAWLLPRLSEMLFAAVLFGLTGIAPRLLNQDGDTGRHLAVGRTILATLQIPRLDIFSHTLSGQPLSPHEWLAQVVFALSERAFGLSGVTLVTALTLAAAFTLAYAEARRRSQMPILALGITLLGLAAASLHFLARPHVFTILFTILWLVLLERMREGRPLSPLWLGLVMLVWANTHGAFIAGFVIGAAFLAEALWEDARRKPFRLSPFSRALLIGGGLALAASLLNPVGVGVWRTAFDFLSSRYLVGHTQEYLPPNFQQATFYPFLVMIGLSVWLVGNRRVSLPLSHRFLLAGWTAMGLFSARNIPLYAVVALPILAQALARVVHGGRWEKFETAVAAVDARLRGVVWIPLSVIVLILSILFVPAVNQASRFDPRVFPVAAVDWVEQHPQSGRMFNYFPWGGYLLYRLYPEYRVFIDGQTDFYGEALTREYETVITLAKGWEDVLGRHSVEWAIIPADEPLRVALQTIGWQEVYADSTAVVLRR